MFHFELNSILYYFGQIVNTFLKLIYKSGIMSIHIIYIHRLHIYIYQMQNRKGKNMRVSVVYNFYFFSLTIYIASSTSISSSSSSELLKKFCASSYSLSTLLLTSESLYGPLSSIRASLS